MQWGNAIGEPYTGNPYVRFDEGTEVVRPPPTLHYGFDIQGERAGYEGVAGAGDGEGVEGVWSRGIWV